MELNVALCQNALFRFYYFWMLIVNVLLGFCVALESDAENRTDSSETVSPDSDKLNILFGVFALMLIIAVMSGVAMCIVKGNQMEAERADDNEPTDDITERTLLTTSSWKQIDGRKIILFYRSFKYLNAVQF